MPRFLLEKAARLRDEAGKLLELARGLSLNADRELFRKSAGELRQEAMELERRAAAMTPCRPAQPIEDLPQQNVPQPKKGSAGSNDPEPQA